MIIAHADGANIADLPRQIFLLLAIIWVVPIHNEAWNTTFAYQSLMSRHFVPGVHSKVRET